VRGLDDKPSRFLNRAWARVVLQSPLLDLRYRIAHEGGCRGAADRPSTCEVEYEEHPLPG
jgi:hypothetical protein